MELFRLPPETIDALHARSVSARTIVAIRLVITCLEEVCEWVSQDTGSDRLDDATSRGGLRWRRARNYVVQLLEAGDVPELRGIQADTTDNALQIPIDGTRISFYAARHGIDSPDLSGKSKVKKTVVSEMQLEIDGLDAPAAPSRLVLLYEADQDGLLSAAIGKLSSEKEWAEDWRFSVFERALGAPLTQIPPSDVPSYDEQPEPELPPLEVLPHEDEGAGTETRPGE